MQPKYPGYKPLSDSLKSIADPLLGSTGRLLGTLKLYWWEIMGAELAACCRPGKLTKQKDGQQILTVEVPSGHALLLQHQLPEMLSRLHQFLGYPAINAIKLLQVPGYEPVTCKEPVKKMAKNTQAMPPILQNIEDKELQAALKNLFDALPSGIGQQSKN